jgi:hypothetical protein
MSVAISLSALNSFQAIAQEYQATSTNFISRDSDINSGGGNSTSTNFELIQSGVEISTGESSSTSFLLRDGPLDYSSFSPFSQNWRWYDDENNATPTSSLAIENIAPVNIIDGNTIKLRITIKEVAGIGQSGAKFKIQYSEYSDFSQETYDAKEISICTVTSTWCYDNGAGNDNAVITSSTLSDADSCVGGIGNGCGTHNESAISTSTLTHNANAATEYEFTIKHSGAKPGTTYFFRVFDTVTFAPVVINTGETYPSLVTGGVTLSFTISGLGNGTSTEGIVTDTTSTATSIPFGALAFGSEKEGAQRLTVSTNATQGYQILLLQDQELLNQSADEIPSISATNNSPLGWNSGCYATSSGCYGYHAGDDSLAGGSARFAANDTYAGVENTPREIAYSSIPVTAETVDVIYKILARENQPAGAYASTVTYIVVPTF